MISGVFEDGIRDELARLHGPELQRAMRNAFRRAANRMKADAIRRFRQRGVGRSIWGKKAKGVPISLGRAKVSDGKIEADITAKGLAGLQETGGRTQPPKSPIKAKPGGALVFQFHGKTVFATSVNHRGSSIPRIPSIDPALEAGSGQVMDEIEAAVDALIGRAGL